MSGTVSLPAYLLRFVGRRRETDIIRDLLGDEAVRWITVTGPGGVGKTRLAVESVRLHVQQSRASSLGSLPEEQPRTDEILVWFVSFAGVTDSSLVPTVLARRLAPTTTDTDPFEVIRQTVAHQRAIMILDNANSVVDAAADLVNILILPGCERLTMITTCHMAFNLPGEHLLSVAPLGIPHEAETDVEVLRTSEAVDLFLSCARAARADLAVPAEQIPVVAGICRRVDGLPLAIELAARRARRYSIPVIASQLQASRLSLDGGEAVPGFPGRLSLRDSIASSYDRLSAPLRDFFLRLSVFTGGISTESARRVAGGFRSDRGYPSADGYGISFAYGDYIPDPGLSSAPQLRTGALDLPPLALDPEDALEQLADLSLLQRAIDERGETRYQFLETIGEFAHDGLVPHGMLDAAHHLHASIMLALADAACEGLWVSHRRTIGIDYVDTELTNIRSAMQWLIERGPDAADLAIHLADLLQVYFQMRGMLNEGIGWIKRALAVEGGASYHRVNGLNSLGFNSWLVGDLDTAEMVIDQALTLLAGTDYAALIAKSHFYRALVLWRRGPERLLEMIGHLEQSLDYFAAWNDQIGQGVCKLALGEVARVTGQDELARQLFQEALTAHQEAGFDWGTATGHWFIGEQCREDGREQEAAASLAAGLRVYRRTGDRLGMSGCLAGIACLITARREWDAAARFFGVAAVLRERSQSILPPTHEAGHAAVLETVLAAIGDRAFEEGKTLDPIATIEQALAIADRIAAGSPMEVAAPSEQHELTRMQKAVLRLLAEGNEPKAIALKLDRGLSSVYRHLENLRSRFECETDDELRRKAVILMRAELSGADDAG